MSSNNLPKCPFEHIVNPELEAQQIAETSEITVKLLDKRYPPPCQILRGVHPKSHGCVKATFTVNSDIAPELQVGLFATPGKTFEAVIRFSNADARIEKPDLNEAGQHGSRGMAIKVQDVGGEVVELDNGANNQDFLMINQPVFAFANMQDYLRLDKVLDQDNDVPDRFFSPLQLQNPKLPEEQQHAIQAYMVAENIDAAAVKRIAESAAIVHEIQAPTQRPPVANPLGAQYFSAAPFLYGSDQVMKFTAIPLAEVTPDKIPPPPAQNFLREALTASLQKTDVYQFDFRVQLRNRFDDVDLEIENASFEWDAQRYPFVSVANITIASPQTEVDTEASQAHCERLVFTPWHALVEHQPIGSINRLRKAVYQASAQHRLKSPDALPGIIKWLEQLFKKLFA